MAGDITHSDRSSTATKRPLLLPRALHISVTHQRDLDKTVMDLKWSLELSNAGEITNCTMQKKKKGLSTMPCQMISEQLYQGLCSLHSNRTLIWIIRLICGVAQNRRYYFICNDFTIHIKTKILFVMTAIELPLSFLTTINYPSSSSILLVIH